MERPNLLPAGPGSVSGRFGLTSEDIRRRFADLALSPDHGRAGRGDHELNPGTAPATALRAAAVLVPLIDRAEGLSILLTRRTEHLSRHPGQIAFPGGQVEDDDEDEIAAALRETEEEIGLSRAHVEPLGRLDRYVTRTGFTVTPIVGIVHPPFELALDAHEVADAFEVPLDFILDPANRERRSGEFQGILRHYYVFPFGERFIWGATAGMLVNLADTLADCVRPH
jgi:8-oxo-dGTP pyrophosphatase MutT (NUDIX family)